METPIIANPNPNSLQSPPSPPPPAPPPAPPRSFAIKRPSLRLTSEFDSENQLFFHKVSSKLFDGLAKLKLSFQNDQNGDFSLPRIGLITKHFSVLYDADSRNALLSGSFDLSESLKVKATHSVKDQQGEVAMVASLADPSYKFELSSAVPPLGLFQPRATLRFPNGEVSLEEKENEELKRVLSVNGILKGQLLNGVCTAMYMDNNLNLRYAYKDQEMTFIPSISLPSNVPSIAFKRRFSPSDKLSYWYHFDSNAWSTVYKHTYRKDLKFKAGYDSEVRLGWASLWVGDENGKAKTAPLKMKVQCMLQVPQDDFRNSAVMFRVKKRWDI
ncbi:outer envelope pore protein 37, chloroplastic isoform X1 [Asparagus officinalis]|uniref:outer envelope pore protein 37, chloroplastic isoform X1 n=1 Tax=Asparagus officinalis TaxID=4686 RepID=UPI00098E1C2B|nr:outer envelope pore protein 37, chloroplastic isoform X1 [Asparagus officinalis]